MRRTERIEQAEIDQVFEAERTKEPRYPIIERTTIAQLGNTVIKFTDYDSDGNYMVIE